LSRQRSSSLVLGSLLALSTGLAFAGGARLRQGQSKVPTVPLKAGVGSAQVAEIGHTVPPHESQAQDFGGTFETVLAYVKDQYYDKLPSESKMAAGSVKQMVAALEDPYSFYLEAPQRALLESEVKGTFSGIGAVLSIQGTKKDGYTDYKIVVVSPLPGSPAEKAGLKPGDTITHVDGKWVLGYDPMLSFIKVVQKFQNREVDDKAYEKARIATRDKIAGGIRLRVAEFVLRGDTTLSKAIANKDKVSLTVQRKGVATPIKTEVAFGKTEVPSVSTKTLDGKVTYLKIPYVSQSSDKDVETALAALPADSAGLVLDLRGASGGSFEAMQRIAGLLAGRGTVAIEVAAGGRRASLVANEEAKTKVPLTVLVNQGTSSTAEALASCLNERTGAPLVGEKTFGDALVQGLYLLEDGTGFTLTAGRLLSSKGVGWAGVGLSPQVTVAAGTPESDVLARAVATLKSRQVAGTPHVGGKG